MWETFQLINRLGEWVKNTKSSEMVVTGKLPKTKFHHMTKVKRRSKIHQKMLTERKKRPDFNIRQKRNSRPKSHRVRTSVRMSLLPIITNLFLTLLIFSLSLSNSSTPLTISSGSKCLTGVSSLNPWPAWVGPPLRFPSASQPTPSLEGWEFPSTSCGTSSEWRSALWHVLWFSFVFLTRFLHIEYSSVFSFE